MVNVDTSSLYRWTHRPSHLLLFCISQMNRVKCARKTAQCIIVLGIVVGIIVTVLLLLLLLLLLLPTLTSVGRRGLDVPVHLFVCLSVLNITQKRVTPKVFELAIRNECGYCCY